MTQQQRTPAKTDDRTSGAAIIKRAVELMAAGKARGWSDALKQASEKVK